MRRSSCSAIAAWSSIRNRPFEAPDCIPPVSDGTAVPANASLAPEARQERWRAIYQPFHDRIAQIIDRRLENGGAVRLVAVHSFTPRKRISDGDRPWLLGLLHGPDVRLAEALAMALGAETAKAINLTFNAPYIVDHQSDYTLPVHGECRALPNVLLEIRQDQIGDADGQERWADLLARAFLRITDELIKRVLWYDADVCRSCSDAGTASDPRAICTAPHRRPEFLRPSRRWRVQGSERRGARRSIRLLFRTTANGRAAKYATGADSIQASRRRGALYGYRKPDARRTRPFARLQDYRLSRPQGLWDGRVLEEVAPEEDEIVLPKTSSSVFISTHIDYVLRNLGVRQLVILGLVTDQCVELAVRDACDLGYLVTLVPDACGRTARSGTTPR